jgi:hypothetical protein
VRVLAPARPFFVSMILKLFNQSGVTFALSLAIIISPSSKQKSSLPQVRQTAFDDSTLQLLFLLLLNRIQIQIKHTRPLLHFHFVILYL